MFDKRIAHPSKEYDCHEEPLRLPRCCRQRSPPAVSFAQWDKSVARAEVRADLVRVEQATTRRSPATLTTRKTFKPLKRRSPSRTIKASKATAASRIRRRHPANLLASP